VNSPDNPVTMRATPPVGASPVPGYRPYRNVCREGMLLFRSLFGLLFGLGLIGGSLDGAGHMLLAIAEVAARTQNLCICCRLAAGIAAASMSFYGFHRIIEDLLIEHLAHGHTRPILSCCCTLIIPQTGQLYPSRPGHHGLFAAIAQPCQSQSTAKLSSTTTWKPACVQRARASASV
jgi:hypothetical protein